MADDVTVPGQTPALPTADDATGPTVEELQAQLAEERRQREEREHDLKVYKDTLAALGTREARHEEPVRQATQALAALRGVEVGDRVLDELFARFCIGK